jgi:hypothetical protein
MTTASPSPSRRASVPPAAVIRHRLHTRSGPRQRLTPVGARAWRHGIQAPLRPRAQGPYPYDWAAVTLSQLRREGG